MLHGTMRVLLLVATLCASASAGPPLNSPLPERRYNDESLSLSIRQTWRGCTWSDTTATDFDCRCDTSSTTNDCTADKFCWVDRTCNNAAKQVTRCTTSDTTATGADCLCDKQIDGFPRLDRNDPDYCAEDEFCWSDYTCHKRAKMSTGAKIGVVWIVAGVWFAVCWICPLPFLALKTWN